MKKKMDHLTKEYKEHLEDLHRLNLNEFMKNIKEIINKAEYKYKDIEKFINECIPSEFLKIFEDNKFIELYYLQAQAEYFKKELNLKENINLIKTLIYCYNTNEREFNKNIKENNLKIDLEKRGFILYDLVNKEKEDLKNFIETIKDKKLIVVTDFNKIGLMGSFSKTEEKEGKIIYSDCQNCLMFIPKRYRTRGNIIYKRFYYKELKK
jgi:hypothetical protein